MSALSGLLRFSLEKGARMIKLVAFDVSDTLYPTGNPRLYDAFRLAEQGVLQKHGFDVPSMAYWQAVEQTSRQIHLPEWKNNPLRFPIVLLQNLGISSEEIVQEIGKEFGIVQKHYQTIPTFLDPKAKKAIFSLHENGYLLAIVSDTSTSWVRDQLKKDGLSDYFSLVLLSNELGFGKGSGELFKVLKKEGALLGIKPQEMVMIGDLSVDMDCAKEGIIPILYQSQTRPFDHFTHQPRVVIHDWDTILAIIRGL